MKQVIRRSIVMAAVMAAGLVGGARMMAQTPTTCPSGSTAPTPAACIPNQVMNAQFTNAAITVDGSGSEAAWNTSTPYPLQIPMNGTALASYPGCGISANARTLWDGNLLYILMNVTDYNITSGSTKGYVLLDFYNQKWKKYTDSLGAVILTYNNTASPANATMSYAGVVKDRVNSYAIKVTGANTYNIELALNMGGLPRVNGSKVGMDFEVYGAASTASGHTYNACQVAWADGLASGSGNSTSGGDLQGPPYAQPENSATYGNLVYAGYDGSSTQALDTYVLRNNLKIVNNLTDRDNSNPGLAKFTDLTALNAAITAANAALTSTSQTTIDAANTQLTTAMYGLRIAGPGGAGNAAPYPDPFDLPSVYTLPDPFTFFDGTRVNSLADWSRRRDEIKNLAQYYEYGFAKPGPYTVTGTVGTGTSALSGAATYYTLATAVTDTTINKGTTFNARLTVPNSSIPNPAGIVGGPYPVIASIDGGSSTGSATFINAGYAVLSCGYTSVSADSSLHTSTLPYFTLYPFSQVTATEGSTNDTGSLVSWGWGCSRAMDALTNLMATNTAFSPRIDLSKAVVTGFSRLGKSALVTGMLDTRFGVVSAGGSGSGGAAPYRYDNIGYPPCQTSFGHVYPWTTTPYSVWEENDEAMADHVWHNPWNSNQMFPRFLSGSKGKPGWFPMDENGSSTNATDYTTPGNPMIGSQLYAINCPAYGWGDRLPYDHHEVIAAIAPRAVIIDSTNNDYSDMAEGDAIGVEGAKPVFSFLGVPQYLATDQNMTQTGHGRTAIQTSDIVAFSNMVFYNIPLSSTAIGQNMLSGVGDAIHAGGQSPIYVDPYGEPNPAWPNAANIYNTYFGGLNAMMPWLTNVPHANLLTDLKPSAGTLSPAFSEAVTSYSVALPLGATGFQITPVAEDPKATITVNSQSVASGQASQAIALIPGATTVSVEVTAQDGTPKIYEVAVDVNATTTTTLTSSTANSNMNSAITFTATVSATQGSGAPTGSVTFMDGSTALGSAALTAGGATTSTATYSISTLAVGTHSITAVFAGSAGFVQSSSAALTETVAGPGLTAALSSASISVAGGSTATTTLTLTPVGGYTGSVSLACGTLPSALLTCSFTPASITFTGTNVVQTSTLNIGTTAVAGLRSPAMPGSKSKSGIAFGFVAFPIGLLALFGGRRSGARKLFLFAALAVLSMGAMLAVSGCSSTKSNNAPAGSYVVPVTMTANGATTNFSVVVVIH